MYDKVQWFDKKHSGWYPDQSSLHFNSLKRVIFFKKLGLEEGICWETDAKTQVDKISSSMAQWCEHVVYI